MIGDLRHARRRLYASIITKPKARGEKLQLNWQCSHLADYKDTKLRKGLNSNGLSSRPSRSNHVQNKRQPDRLVILPMRVLTCAILRLTKRTNHLRGSHS